MIKIDFVRALEGSLGAILSQDEIAQFWDLTVIIPSVLLINNLSLGKNCPLFFYYLLIDVDTW